MPAPSSDHKPSIDVRTLNLSQLKMLADKGSRRARAELEGRMRAMSAGAAPTPVSGPAPVAPAVSSATAATRAAAPAPAAAVPSEAPVIKRPAAAPFPVDFSLKAVAGVPAAGADAAGGDDQLVQRLRLMAQQEEARARAEGPPRLMGMVLMGWGLLLGLGGLVMLASRFGGGFYAVCGLVCAGVGWLLWRSSRLALYAHGVALVLMLGWAWHEAHGSFGLALVQAAPLWIAALWMLARPIREPLA